jgi:hypothetical protein
VNTIGIKVKIVLIKAYNSVKIVKRYHGPIRQAYFIVMTEIPSIDKDITLQMAFKAINDTVRLDGLVLTLLVYSTLPRMVKYNALSFTIT